MTGLLVVGRVGRPHGIEGAVYVSLVTDRTERLDPGTRLSTDRGEYVVRASRRHNERWIVTFEGITDRDAAAGLTNLDLRAEPIADDDAVWVHDLIGSTVREANGTERGTCIGVIANPADDILELDTGALVPARFVLSCVDGITTVEVPEGLFDLV